MRDTMAPLFSDNDYLGSQEFHNRRSEFFFLSASFRCLHLFCSQTLLQMSQNEKNVYEMSKHLEARFPC